MMGSWHEWLAVSALVMVTVLTRGIFLVSRTEWRMPPWLRRGLRHAPLAALMAIVAPEIWLTPGLGYTGPDARWLAVAACGVWFFWVRRSVTGALLAGSAAYLAFTLF